MPKSKIIRRKSEWYRCEKCNNEFLSRASEPRCSSCRSRLVVGIDEVRKNSTLDQVPIEAPVENTASATNTVNDVTIKPSEVIVKNEEVNGNDEFKSPIVQAAKSLHKSNRELDKKEKAWIIALLTVGAISLIALVIGFYNL